jgi:hypothetical protein
MHGAGLVIDKRCGHAARLDITGCEWKRVRNRKRNDQPITGFPKRVSIRRHLRCVLTATTGAVPQRTKAADWHSGALTCYKLLSWGNGGITMLRYRLALVAAGILLLTAPSAWAFSQQNAGSGGNGNSSFADPDDQITNSFGVRPLDSNGQSKLGGQQQGTFDPIWWEQSLHGYGPYYQTHRPGH